MDPLDMKYAGIVGLYLDGFTVKNNSPYRANFRCDVCGDSTAKKNKMRGWLLEMDDLRYYCHNCDASYKFWFYLKEHHPAIYGQYIAEKYVDKATTKTDEEQTVKTDHSKIKAIISDPNKALRNIKKISSLKSTHPAKKYVDNRKIPPNTHFMLYFAPKFNAWVNEQIPGKMNDRYDEPRLVLPFMDENGKMFGFTGRSFKKDTDQRYITIMLEDRPKIFGLNRLDPTKPYYVFEGGIDSLFMENAVAMAGADLNLSSLPNPENATVVMDNEPRNAQVVKRVESLIRHKKNVVIWPKDSNIIEINGKTIKRKDINDLVLTGMSAQDIDDYLFMRSFKGGLTAQLEFGKWKKV